MYQKEHTVEKEMNMAFSLAKKLQMNNQTINKSFQVEKNDSSYIYDDQRYSTLNIQSQISDVRRRARKLQKSIECNVKKSNKRRINLSMLETENKRSATYVNTPQNEPKTRMEFQNQFHDLKIHENDGNVIIFAQDALISSNMGAEHLSNDQVIRHSLLERSKVIDNLTESRINERKDENNNTIKKMRLDQKIRITKSKLSNGLNRKKIFQNKLLQIDPDINQSEFIQDYDIKPQTTLNIQKNTFTLQRNQLNKLSIDREPQSCLKVTES